MELTNTTVALLATGPDMTIFNSARLAETPWHKLMEITPPTRSNAMVHIACRSIGVDYRYRKLQESYRVRQD